MKDKIYILFNQKGVKTIFKRTKTVKSLPSGTYMAELNLEVDNDFFKNQIPVFNMKLESENIVKPEIKQEVIPEKRGIFEMFFSSVDESVRTVNLNKKEENMEETEQEQVSKSSEEESTEESEEKTEEKKEETSEDGDAAEEESESEDEDEEKED